MTAFSKIVSVWFIGIGGIGMSALARYFLAGGYQVGGYDRIRSALTDQLEAEGCSLLYNDDPGLIDATFLVPGKTMVVYTPAIPAFNRILGYFSENDFDIKKRSEILGLISEQNRTIAIAGTHGKTSVSTYTAHLLKQAGPDCSAFLGGISRNYNTNLLLGESDLMVMEADEYDRSFHRLQPELALITSLDADHLDVYGDYETMAEAYEIFLTRVCSEGTIILNEKVAGRLKLPSGIKIYTYGFGADNDFRAKDIDISEGNCRFTIALPEGNDIEILLLLPGRMNIENALASVAAVVSLGVQPEHIARALMLYKGVKRRFDVRINTRSQVYIDDYAHHPEELKYCISSVREFYSGRRVTGIFQPHLFTRTRDHADSFAASLDMLDQAILLPVYPAREEPIEGVDSSIILDKMELADKRLIERDEVPGWLAVQEIDVLLTIGAGDIDRLVEPIEMLMKGGVV